MIMFTLYYYFDSKKGCSQYTYNKDKAFKSTVAVHEYKLKIRLAISCILYRLNTLDDTNGISQLWLLGDVLLTEEYRLSNWLIWYQSFK